MIPREQPTDVNPANPVCEVCGGEVGRADALLSRRKGHVVCRSGECQGLLAQKATMDPTVYKAHFALQSRLIRQRTEREVRRKEHEAVVDAAEAEDNRRILDAVRRERGVDGEPRLMVIPTGLGNLVPMSPERRAHYKANLQAAIEEALGFEDLEAMPRDMRFAARERALRSDALLAAHPALEARTDALCARCKGGCCSTGQDKAFISGFTVRRVLDENPSTTPEELLDFYLSHVPDESVEGACINQTATGCALPRAWRSDICNGFFCDALKTLHEGWTEEAPRSPVLVIRRANHNWNRYSAVSTNAVREVVWMDEAGVQTLEMEGLALPRPEGETGERGAAATLELSDARDNLRILEQVRRQTPEAGEPAVVGIPSGRARVVPVSEERRGRYRAHLEAVVAEAATFSHVGAIPGGDDTAARARNLETEAFLRDRPALRRRTDHVCGMCKGACCVTGREHAHLSALTVRRVLDADPALTPEGVLETYLAHLPAESIEGACINQTAAGCALPRAWRSDVCNGYFCPPLAAYHQAWDEDAHRHPVLVVRRNYHTDERVILSAAAAVAEVAVVDETGVRPVALEGREGPGEAGNGGDVAPSSLSVP